MVRPSRLQEEIRQGRPFSSSQQEGVLGLLRTADVVRRRLAAAIEPRGVTLQQYNVLRILRGAGAEGLPTLDIADRMIERTPGVTRLLGRLAAKGLVRRRRCSRDHRQVLCFISPRGLALLGSLEPVVASLDRDALGGLDEGRVRRLVHLLDAVRAGGGAPATSPSRSSTTQSKKENPV
jgi:DNA-binding MarR family transcriptional regulator